MLELLLLTPKNNKKYTNLKKVFLPELSGVLQILTNHVETFSLLRAGEITIIDIDNIEKTIEITSGGCHIKNNLITIIL